MQQPIYVHKEHFYYNPFSDLESGALGNQAITRTVDGEVAGYLLTSQRLPAGVQLAAGAKRDYTLDLQDVPAKLREANTPPENGLWYRVRFYWTPYTSAAVYWDNETKRWSKELDQFAAQTGTIRNAAGESTAGADTPEAKARKLYDIVQALENTDFTRAKTKRRGSNCT